MKKPLFSTDAHGNVKLVDKSATSLSGAPRVVKGDFNFSYSRVEKFDGWPEDVSGNLSCNSSRLTSLVGSPKRVGGTFNCSDNQLTSLRYGPGWIYHYLNACSNPITDLKDVNKHIHFVGREIWLAECPIKSHVLGVLLIDGLQKILLDDQTVEEILNKYLPSKGIESALLAQEELIQAGLEEFAQL